MDSTMQDLTISPEEARKWADEKREKSLETIRAQYQQRCAERILADYDRDYRIEGRQIEDPGKLDIYVSGKMASNPRCQELRTQMDDLEEKIGCLEIERTYASDMLRIQLEFAYFGDMPTSAISLECIVEPLKAVS